MHRSAVACYHRLISARCLQYCLSGSHSLSRFCRQKPISDVRTFTNLSRSFTDIFDGAGTALIGVRRQSMMASPANAVSADSQTELAGQQDRYDGIILDSDALPSDPAEFSARLAYSIQEWQHQSRKGIWLKVPISLVQLVEPAVQQGFIFHHAEPDYVQLCRWLPATPSKLPANASHQVGVGCFVLNKQQEVLLVQEKSGPLRGMGVWKMVTGLVDAGEDIIEAAAREVLEETGVRAAPSAVLALRQAHGFAFGKSDFFFVVALTPEPGQRKLVMQEDELDAVTWMPLEEYAAIPFYASRPLHKHIMEACMAYARGEYKGMTGIKLSNGFNGHSDLLVTGEWQRSSSF